MSEWPNCTLSVPPPGTTHPHLGEVRLPECLLPDAVSEDTPSSSCSRMAHSDVAMPFEFLDTKLEAFNAVTDEIESVPGFQEYFHDHFHMPFGNKLLHRLDTDRVKRLNASTRMRQPRHVLSDPLLWHGLEVAMPRRTPPRP